MAFSFYFALGLLAGTALLLGYMARGLAQMTRLERIPAGASADVTWPMVSIIVAARNEERHLEEGLLSLLNLEYPDYEIIVVDDRSTDRTGIILDRLAQQEKRLKVIHLSQIAEGWLGKNHAVWKGAGIARGAFLLFSDADVRLEKSVLRRAMQRVQQADLDHLSLFFDVHGVGGLLHTVMLEIAGGLLLQFRPWRAGDPRNNQFMGVGAFNLVKSAAYWKCQGHEAIPMCPIDDIMLGKLLKQNGCRQECALAGPLVSVPWYDTLAELVRGLEKNIYAGFGYNLFAAFGGLALLFVAGIWPLWGVALESGATRIIYLALIGLRLLAFALGAATSSYQLRSLPWALVSPYVLFFAMINAVVKAEWHGGIFWRGTFYPLEQLKKQAAINSKWRPS